MLRDVVVRCKELALTIEETELLLDLLGWNMKETKQIPPLSHRGLKIYGGLSWYERELSDKIKALCEKLLGYHLEAARLCPDVFFRAHYTSKEASRGVGVLLCQLDIKSSDVDYHFLPYLAPEILYRSFILIMAFLLDCTKDHG